jgi:DNA-binding NarL/FixJ family response regulator
MGKPLPHQLSEGVQEQLVIVRRLAGARFLFVTMQMDRICVAEGFRAGGMGSGLKHTAARELVEAIGTVLRDAIDHRIAGA